MLPAVYRVKSADLVTPLQPHQQRVIDKLRASGGVLVAHGLGSGKTLSSIAASEAMGLPTDVVTPAPLVGNYQKEMEKHIEGEHPETRVRSYQRAIKGGINPKGLVVADEAQKMRNAGTATRALGQQMQKARARLLLTGTPVYNQPWDVAPLLNIAAGRDVLPGDPKKFQAHFMGEKMVNPPWWQRAMGVRGANVPELKHREDLVNAATGYVDVHHGGGEGFPEKREGYVDVPLTEKQRDIYKYLEGPAPWWLKMKVHYNLPLSKSESSDLNRFYSGVRQASNTARPFDTSMSDEDEDREGKLHAMVERVKTLSAKDPHFKSVLYSNYLSAGINPLARMLKKENIPYGAFTGEVPPGERKRLVDEYNRGNLRALLLSSSGGEGLDLKGTKYVGIAEPHFNEPKIEQVIGRGVRYKSHEDLPPEERNVQVERFRSVFPESTLNRWGITKKKTSIDEFLQSRAEEKTRLSEQIMAALQEASDRGALKRAGLTAVPPPSIVPKLPGVVPPPPLKPPKPPKPIPAAKLPKMKNLKEVAEESLNLWEKNQ
jgi:hypothetical protein